jgi:hypothetical protein
LFNLGVVALSFAASEAYVVLNQTPGAHYSDGYMIEDDVLGTVPSKGHQGYATKSIGGALLYDVTYSINADGLRLAPPVSDETAGGCVLFFGDSFTFGEGLEDAETLPYQVGIQSGGRYKTFNFGFHGYGPHQMLAQIEHGIVNHVVDCHPMTAIYSALADHAFRVAGKVWYGQHSPRYKLAPQGTVGASGHFDDKRRSSGRIITSIRRQLEKSALYQVLESPRRDPSQDDIQLMLAIVAKSRDLLAAQYPGIKFHVLLWRVVPDDEPIYQQLPSGFTRMKIPVHRVEDILPGYTDGPHSLKYVLSPRELHPNALANRLLAAYVLKNIIAGDTRS